MSEIIIRSAVPSDAAALLRIYAPYVENTAITFEYTVPSEEEFAGRIANTLRKYPYLVMILDGEIAAYAYAGAFKGRAAYDWACEMTIYVGRDHHGKGFGRILYQALEEQLAGMGMLNLYACIAYPDTEDEYLTRNSADFHAHLGYTLCGRFHDCGYKFGRWYDMIWMEKIVGVHGAETAPIRHPGSFYREMTL